MMIMRQDQRSPSLATLLVGSTVDDNDDHFDHHDLQKVIVVMTFCKSR